MEHTLVQTTSLSPKRAQWHISLAYPLLLALLAVLVVASPAANSQEAGETKPKPQGKNYDPDAVKHYNRGLELHNSGFLNKAVEEYRAAIKADDRLEQAYSNLGLIYIAQKNYSRAQEAFDRALAVKPNRSTSLNGLASVLYALNQVQPAIDTWKKAIHFNPKFASAYFNMGTALEHQKNYQEALDAWVKAVTIAPDMADAYYHMGVLLNKQNHPAQAEVLFERAVTLSPESEFARDARKQMTNIKEKFVKDPTDISAEVPMVLHGSRPVESEKANRAQDGSSNKDRATKNPPDSSTNQTPTQAEGASSSAGTTESKTSTTDGTATNGNTGAAGTTPNTAKDSHKKRKPLFKRGIKPQNDEEKAKANQPEEIKMFVKPPEQDSDLQSKPQ